MQNETMNTETNDNPIQRAHDYAWGWFTYHAEQRLKSFSFFFVLVGALTAGYLTSIGASHWPIAAMFGIMLLFSALLFWRLDARNAELIKLAEQYLKKSEINLAAHVGQEICLAHEADKDTTPFKVSLFPNILSTYRKVFRAMFVIVVVFSLFATGYAVSTVWSNGEGGNLGGSATTDNAEGE
ncbi:hypothetical protein [Roseitalea porphyridii]|uniref:Uncharacterized protein n=1 Tax=Roseitalea porphyridii TaxID=1852022 RepID=A0A4P6V1G2_9HYPH|nr:hypothetical protein [Roseitalea porphyridii]QBK31191.1 hypothetical protein E0E05_11630 [Roseitalea porphyridii]